MLTTFSGNCGPSGRPPLADVCRVRRKLCRNSNPELNAVWRPKKEAARAKTLQTEAPKAPPLRRVRRAYYKGGVEEAGK